MGLHMRDDRQRKALTGISHAQGDPLLPVFWDLDRATPQHMYEAGVASGTRRRHPGGGATGKRPTMAEQWPFVLSDSKTSLPCDVLGTPCEMARSQAHECRHTLSPMLDDTLGHLELMPSRVLTTPEEWKAAWQGGDCLLMDATARA